ncbi:MAG TPA: hypothetical protein VED40_05530 [Azospirillaceae bacterium]|nr:hypothetical protein [Azospirillaceae bacterium]
MRASLLALAFLALTAMTPDPLWQDAERVLVRCHVDRGGAPADPAGLEGRLCGGLAGAVASRLKDRLPVEVATPADARIVEAGSVLLLLHARVQPVAEIVPETEGSALVLSLQTGRGDPAAQPAPSWFKVAPKALPFPLADAPLRQAMDALAADLLGR